MGKIITLTPSTKAGIQLGCNTCISNIAYKSLRTYDRYTSMVFEDLKMPKVGGLTDETFFDMLRYTARRNNSHEVFYDFLYYFNFGNLQALWVFYNQYSGDRTRKIIEELAYKFLNTKKDDILLYWRKKVNFFSGNKNEWDGISDYNFHDILGWKPMVIERMMNDIYNYVTVSLFQFMKLSTNLCQAFREDVFDHPNTRFHEATATIPYLISADAKGQLLNLNPVEYDANIYNAVVVPMYPVDDSRDYILNKDLLWFARIISNTLFGKCVEVAMLEDFYSSIVSLFSENEDRILAKGLSARSFDKLSKGEKETLLLLQRDISKLKEIKAECIGPNSISVPFEGLKSKDAAFKSIWGKDVDETFLSTLENLNEVVGKILGVSSISILPVEGDASITLQSLFIPVLTWADVSLLNTEYGKTYLLNFPTFVTDPTEGYTSYLFKVAPWSDLRMYMGFSFIS